MQQDVLGLLLNLKKLIMKSRTSQPVSFAAARCFTSELLEVKYSIEQARDRKVAVFIRNERYISSTAVTHALESTTRWQSMDLPKMSCNGDDTSLRKNAYASACISNTTISTPAKEGCERSRILRSSPQVFRTRLPPYEDGLLPQESTSPRDSTSIPST